MRTGALSLLCPCLAVAALFAPAVRSVGGDRATAGCLTAILLSVVGLALAFATQGPKRVVGIIVNALGLVVSSVLFAGAFLLASSSGG